MSQVPDTTRDTKLFSEKMGVNINFLQRLESLISTRIFRFRDVVALSLGFLAVIVLAGSANSFVCKNVVGFDCPDYWPISVFSLRTPGWEDVLIAAAVLLLSVFAIKHLSSINYKLPQIIFVSIVLILGTNLIQGWGDGFLTPISGGKKNGIVVPVAGVGDNVHQYYHDALKISDAFSFFRNYEELQPKLRQHSHTHPPGPALTMYWLMKIWEHPGFISIAIAVFSSTFSALFFYKLISTEVSVTTARYVTFLFLLIPAIQIYYLASIDALVATFLLGTLYFFRHHKQVVSTVGSIACLFFASFLTFVFVFILPVLFGYEIICRRSIRRFSIVLSGLTLIYVALYALFGFNYLNLFRIASAHENPKGLFGNAWVNYFPTRVEDVAEIAVFFGPFLIVLLIRSLHIARRNKPNFYTLTLLAAASLLAMFATGAWKTGETARACMFIYPYLLLPIAVYLETIENNSREKIQLAGLVFAQAVFMQLIGNYFW